MAIRAVIEFAYDDYASLDDTTTLPVGLTSREAAICASVLQLILNRQAWDATDVEYESIEQTVNDLIEDVQSAV